MPQNSRHAIAACSLIAGSAIGGMLAMQSQPGDDAPAEPRITTELTANTWTGSTQYEPAMAASADGHVLVAWASRRQEDGAFGVFAQLLDSLGRPVGTETHINQHVRGAQASPAAAFDQESGNALVVWESSHQDGSGIGIVGRWFTPSVLGLLPASNEFAINAQRQGDQTTPSVAINAEGAALVTWSTDQGGAVGRLFASGGQALTDEIKLGPAGALAPIAQAGPDGFVIAGAANDPEGRPAALWMQRLSVTGSAGRIEPIAKAEGQQDIEPSLGVDAEGNVTVAWMRRGETGYRVMRRDFDASGAPTTGDQTIATTDDRWLSGAAVAVAPDGRSIVSWNEERETPPAPRDGVGRRSRAADVMAVRFDAEGAQLGAPQQVNETAEGRQRLAVGAVATRSLWTAQDQIVHAWHGRTDRDSSGVGVTLSHPESLTAHQPIAFDPRPAVTPAFSDSSTIADVAPVFDEDFIPEPAEFNVRGGGPDFGFLGIQSTGWRPPDPEIAVGPDHVVVVANAQIIYRRKSDGFATFAQNLTESGGFWGGQGAGGFVFDPIAQFDTESNRFIVAATERQGAQQYINIAISDADDPNGAWNKFRLNVTSYGRGIDFPNLGVDEGAIYVTVDFFEDPIGNWVFILDKDDLIAGTVTMNAVQSEAAPSVLGCMTNYDAGSPAQYFATTYFGNGSQIGLKAITDPLGTPALHVHALAVPSYVQPRDAEQLGSTNLVSTVDFRIKHGVVRNGAMWVAHTTGTFDGDGPFTSVATTRVRWLEIDLNGWPTSGEVPTLTQSGTIDEGIGTHVWQPDITVDDQGNAGMVFSKSSATEYVSMARVVRRATDPPGTFRQAVEMQQSTSPEPEDRWGDYAGIQEDPEAPGTFWGHHEYRTSSWRTWVGRFSPLTPNPLDFDLIAPADEAVDVPTTTTLDWADAEDATSYDVAIATAPDLINTVAVTNVSGSEWAIPSGALSCGVQYYWGVIANSPNGITDSTPQAFAFTTGLVADINGDGVVDTADLGVLISAFGTAGPSGDLNADGVVDTADLGLLISGFGGSCD